MPKVEEIKVLNVDEKVLAVDSQSEEVQQLVATYNEWNQDLADKQKEHAQIRAAVQALSGQIIQTIRNEAAQAVAATEAAAAEAEKVAAADNVTPINATELPAEVPVVDAPAE